MEFSTLILLVLSTVAAAVNGNSEGDALYSWKISLRDPNGVLQSWDPTLVNPCTWFHVTCDSQNSVTRLDLGNAGLSGPLSPELVILVNLQYLEVYGNSLTGTIPQEFGNFTSLVSLGLNNNDLSGVIPSSIANMKSLRFLRLDGNALTGTLPVQILELADARLGNLQLLNVSKNMLSGTVRPTKSKGLVTTTIVQDPRA